MAPIIRQAHRDFFREWSPEMAYVLGYFAADGTMLKNNRGAYFIEFHSTDKNLIHHVRTALGSNHKIGIRKPKPGTLHKMAYRLQIGSKEMYSDLKRIGFQQNKSNSITFPTIPSALIGDFVRGYFDGDGNVYFKQHRVKGRIRPKWIYSSRFTCGSEQFLVSLHKALKEHEIVGGVVRAKSNRRGYELVLSHRDSLALYRLMYNTSRDTGFFLPRKYKTFQKVIRTLYPAMRVYFVHPRRSEKMRI